VNGDHLEVTVRISGVADEIFIGLLQGKPKSFVALFGDGLLHNGYCSSANSGFR
jgi:hypothetical protein